MLSTSGSGVMEDDLPTMHQDDSTVVEEDVVYKAECNQYYSGPHGTVRSPLMPVGPKHYGVDCSWTIDGGKYSICSVKRMVVVVKVMILVVVMMVMVVVMWVVVVVVMMVVMVVVVVVVVMVILKMVVVVVTVAVTMILVIVM